MSPKDFKPQARACDLRLGQKRRWAFCIACRQTSPLFELLERILSEMAVSIQTISGDSIFISRIIARSGAIKRRATLSHGNARPDLVLTLCRNLLRIAAGRKAPSWLTPTKQLQSDECRTKGPKQATGRNSLPDAAAEHPYTSPPYNA